MGKLDPEYVSGAGNQNQWEKPISAGIIPPKKRLGKQASRFQRRWMKLYASLEASVGGRCHLVYRLYGPTDCVLERYRAVWKDRLYWPAILVMVVHRVSPRQVPNDYRLFLVHLEASSHDALLPQGQRIYPHFIRRVTYVCNAHY